MTIKQWKELNPLTLIWMKELGNFSPTVHTSAKEIKGYTYNDDGGSKTYWDSSNLRELASSCNEVADWLDARALEKETK